MVRLLCLEGVLSDGLGPGAADGSEWGGTRGETGAAPSSIVLRLELEASAGRGGSCLGAVLFQCCPAPATAGSVRRASLESPYPPLSADGSTLVSVDLHLR